VWIAPVLGCHTEIMYTDPVSQEDVDINLYFWKLVPVSWGAVPG